MSGPSSPPPQGYQPSNQAGADQNYQQLAGQLGSLAGQIPGMTWPGYQNLIKELQNNPFAGQAQAGAGQVASQGQGLAASQAKGGQQLGSFAQLAPILMQLGMGGAGMALPLLQQGVGQANQAYKTATGAIPGLTGGMGAANQILGTAFDPQGQLYNQLYQQTLAQQNAINAQNGLAGGAAAGLTGQAAQNFNIDWQNQQLARQATGLGAYGQEQGQVANNLTSLLGSASSNYGSLLGSGLGAYAGLNDVAQSGYGAAENGLISGLLNGSALGNQSLQTLASSSSLPSQTYMGNILQQLGGLNQANEGLTGSLNPLSNAINAQGNYLSLGQNATGLAQNAWAMQNQANQQAMSGLGSLFSDFFGSGNMGGGMGGGGGSLWSTLFNFL